MVIPPVADQEIGVLIGDEVNPREKREIADGDRMVGYERHILSPNKNALKASGLVATHKTHIRNRVIDTLDGVIAAQRTQIDVNIRKFFLIAPQQVRENLGCNGICTGQIQGGGIFLGDSVQRHFQFPVIRNLLLGHDGTCGNAAGDTFVGALATRLEEGGLTDAAITYATAASAITVSRSGASSSIPTREEVEAFLRGREEEACAHLLG